MLTAEAMTSGGVLPQPIPIMEAIRVMDGLTTAIPDLSFDIQQVAANGNQAKVKALSSGKNSMPVSLPMPGALAQMGVKMPAL